MYGTFVNQTLVLDLGWGEGALLLALKRTGRKEISGAVLVSHQLGQIRRLYRPVVWLDAGSLRETGPAKEIISAYEVDMTPSSVDTSRPVEGRAQFLRWKLDGSNCTAYGILSCDGQTAVSFLLRVNDHLQ